MANRPSMCLIVLFAVVGKFDVAVSIVFPTIITPIPPNTPPSDNGTAPPIQDSEICPCGKWYAVMATEVSGNGPCNIVTNNKYPCCCTTMDVRTLVDSNWEIIGSSKNIETLELSVTMGGATAETSENKEINGFIVSQASIPASVVDVEPKIIITQNVNGSPMFIKYHLSIIDWNAQNFYMITKLQAPNAPNPFYTVWCRKTHPGKGTIWDSVLDGLKKLDIDPHSMSFIKQDKCSYPTVTQLDEMFFC